ncbi:GerAB/ArcD/ProY family transporter [Halalkalibacter akibai]|uniref:Spore germination protein n=1 Tax=Halalkalibacter akibai (strain ATCC 43226 / DSM 21942 / CIP 109018 / JCM 9157 / 1139) TaxID=1236973 RepID=W4QUN5_HALA3|nr:GerAB/ArcD/ProY family transporter [Halalkalibacter akibai]GAE35880.1 spore germination protein [Halalkalibacter akibai JCM 9157]
MDKPIKEQFLVSGFLTFFLINGMQVGVGILSFQRNIVKTAGYDGWISVLVAGVAVHIIVACIYLLLKRTDGDLVTIHQKLFGKWVGNVLSLFVCFYFIALATTVLRAYIEIVQVWMFPDLPTWSIAIVAALFFYYVVSGGFRTVVGLTFIGVIIPVLLTPMLLLPLEYAQFINILPIAKHSLTEIALGAKETTLSFIGFELLLLYYPFLKNRKLTQKWAQLGVFSTNFSYTILMVISLAFYSEEQLNKTIWATLTLFKVVQLPFMERFEYIGISMWMFLIAPNIALALWGASRCAKRAFTMNQRLALVVALAIMTITVIFLPTRQEVNLFSNWVGEVGFYFVFVYIPFLVLLQIIVLKIRSGKREQTTNM